MSWRASWSLAKINETKANVKLHIEAETEALSSREMLHFILDQARSKSETDDPDDCLACVVWTISSFVHAERLGGLPLTNIAKYKELGLAVLELAKGQGCHASAELLQTELHLALSQLLRRQGKQAEAAWEQALACHSAQTATGPLKQNLIHAQANRALRLGYTNTALKLFHEALSLAENARSQRITLSLIQTLRLQGEWQNAAQMIAIAAQQNTMDDACKAELQWESICLSIQMKADTVREMLKVVRPSKSHRSEIYLVEAFFWMHCFRERRWLQKLPKPSSMTRLKGLDFNRLEHFFRAAQAMERLYDESIPLPIRRGEAAKLFLSAHKLPTLDKELLLKAAVIRWLSRSRSYQLLELGLDEYTKLSWSVTDGKSIDALGLLADVFESKVKRHLPLIA